MATIRLALCSLVLVSLVVLAPAALGQWVEFVEDSSRLDVPVDVGAGDVEEKDYAWGDMDKDGDIDLVVVRKQPFTSPGKKTNHLFMNVNGTLTDRTAEFATSSTVLGDIGFLTPTNDRDVILVDVDIDGWLDMITAVTISDNDPKYIGHPRIYMNRCCEVGGCDATSCDEENWLGFHYDEPRIPQMLSYSGNDNFNPRFCSVSAGDVTGDGYPDLWFGDYDSSGAGGNTQPAGADFNDKYLVNQGASNPGFFDDVTQDPGRLVGTVPGEGQAFEVSAFGAANAIRDMNGDGINDIVKQTSLNPPQYVGIAFNEGVAPDQGFFDTYDAMTQPAAPYHVSVGELNNDNSLDLVITDDGADRYLLNQGGGFVPDWLSYPFQFVHSGGSCPGSGCPAGDDGFGSNNLITDLNNDGWGDIVIADVDVDISGCNRRMHIYRNLGGSPGDQVVLREETTGSNCQNLFGNPASCLVAGIPSDVLKGMHDMAVFDINGDGWKDMVLGRCVGTNIFMNLPPAGPSGAVDQYDNSAQLKAGKAADGDLTLNWGASCSLDDTDYAIYAGRIAAPFTEHAEVVCSTGGATSRTIPLGLDNFYYLVVPNSQILEGSYGQDSDSIARTQGVSSCFPQLVGACE